MRNERTTIRLAPLAAGGCVALLALALGACRQAPPSQDAGPGPAPTGPADTMNPADLADVTASFLCEQDHRVDIVRDKVARVALSDGRVVKIERVDGSVPPTFMDNGLTLSLEADDTALLDDEKGNSVRCERTGAPNPTQAG